MLRRVEASCPGCQAKVDFDVELPDPRIQVVEDGSTIDTLATDLAESHRSLQESQQSVEALRGDLQRWQNGENHLQAADMLEMLQACPNCRPALDAFVGQVRQQTLASLTPEQVKRIAKLQKWWPPPPIEIVTALSRR